MKAALLAPLYLSFSWILTVSYQLFTDTAVRTVSSNLVYTLPAVATWMNSNLQTISFVYAFSWIFVLSSVLPSLILGRDRSVIVQYIVCLMLTFLALSAPAIIANYTGFQVQTIFNASVFLVNPFFALLYLMIPYLFMLVLDVLSKEKGKKERRRPLLHVTTATRKLVEVDAD